MVATKTTQANGALVLEDHKLKCVKTFGKMKACDQSIMALKLQWFDQFVKSIVPTSQTNQANAAAVQASTDATEKILERTRSSLGSGSGSVGGSAGDGAGASVES